MKVKYLLLVTAISATDSIASQNNINPNEEKKAWITIGSDAIQHFTTTQEHKGLALSPQIVQGTDGITVSEINADDINNLSKLMHHEFKRCGGFFYHDSFEEAQAYAKQAASANQSFANFAAVNYTIDNESVTNAMMSETSQQNLTNTVNTLSNYYDRYYTSQSGYNAANWIRNHWAQLAQSRSDINVEFFNHSWKQPSVIATINGTTLADEIVVIGGHLDSINSSNPGNESAPGADDNASGISVLTETLNAIVKSGFKPKRTVKIIGYAAEEVGLRGSKAIAQSYKNSGKNVVGVAQFDMTGNKGTFNRDIVLITDFTNSAQNQFIRDLIAKYLPNMTHGDSQCGYACSDHASWYNEGFPASMPAEASFHDLNPLIHTANDTQFDSSHAIKFAKLSVAFISELAKGTIGGTPPPPPTDDNELQNGVPKTNISGGAKAQQFYTFNVPAGATNLKFTTSGGTGDADLYVKFGSKPSLYSYDCKSTNSSNIEQCQISSAQTGTYHVMVEAWSAISGVTLTASYTGGGNPPPPPTGTEPINETISNISVSRGQWQRYTQTLDEGYSNLTVTISGGFGDADLYVRRGAQSTFDQHDCRPYLNGNNETCPFTSPQSGVWYIDLYGYSTTSGLTLNIKATP
ncbi:M20/M25/M40 family metallo-hydrolase [Vibrio sp. S9_S30]|uniref:M20/M25/M40 family metallo-hydrolase n=1 Tax=Vibrio sp. S9_S30 TaxID=2720226 RepID=UPI0016812C89|nr:M20/M25/M40 family metallo-hydrolase [Vibrio sp. S9_S30]MBD1558063.1 M20/M25/M40 family metallo-hydrolase [Vibrio sp. S9_S30]